jgi:murein DD-endopeptidase MepM/ murein hydrolase activator NlpD
MAEIPGIDVAAPRGAKPGEKAEPSLEQMKSLAAQFESVLLGQMMRQMRESMFEKGDDDEKSSGFTMGPLADQVYAELSLALSRAGGVGLSDALGGALTRQAAPEEPSSTSGVDRLSGFLSTPEVDSAQLTQLPPGLQITSGFGLRPDPIDGQTKFHKGMDIAMPVGQHVGAADAGRVESVGELPGYGLTVVVRHQNGMATRYAHLSEATVKVGEDVTKGQVIAKSGNTGRTTGPHLHFEVLKNGQAMDPGKAIDPGK